MAEASTRGVTVTIDLSAVRANYLEARRLAGGGKAFAVVKADAYGHGALGVAHALSRADFPEARADGFAVVTTGEAVVLRDGGIQQPILVLQGPVDEIDAQLCSEHGLWPVIHDLHQLAWYRRWAAGKEVPAAWLKVDTGMGRLGVRPESVAEIIGADDEISWQGVLSHLACADEPGNAHTAEQIAAFSELTLPAETQRSLANSAAIIGWPATQFDWARPGLMLYGCNPVRGALPGSLAEAAASSQLPVVESGLHETSLRTTMRVTTTLVSVKTRRAGEGVGYAQTWRCPEDMSIGLARIGYADGLPRVLGAQAMVAVRGVDCPIVGRVSMDSIAIDLRKVPVARTGDEVEVWGEQRPVDDLADAAGTIAYELLTSIRGTRVEKDVPTKA